jgi:hypothetical protein
VSEHKSNPHISTMPVETLAQKRERQRENNPIIERDPSLPADRRPSYQPAMSRQMLNRQERRAAKARGDVKS